MTEEELDLSTVKLAGPPPGYETEQGDRSDFDWMTYQLKQLEQILGKDRTAKWLNRQNKQLNDRSPADIVLRAHADHGCVCIAILIRDMIMGLPDRNRAVPVPYDEALNRAKQRSPITQHYHREIWDAFSKLLEDSENPSEGCNTVIEAIMVICRNIHDVAWKQMMEGMSTMVKDCPTNKLIQLGHPLLVACDNLRSYIPGAVVYQDGPMKLIL